MVQRVLIFGIGGQDGSIAADFLLAKGYEVHGMLRRSSDFNTRRIDHIFDKLHLYHGDLTDATNVMSIIKNVQPDYILNFSAQSHVKVSCDLPSYTFQTNTIGLLNILEAVRILGLDKHTRIYQASTSEIFGNMTDGTKLLSEKSPMHPVSPYGIAKLAAHHLANYYRDAYGMFVVSSILFNHEGERRGPTFVTKKISNYVGRYAVSKTQMKPLQLGNLDALRDWGYANDYVEGVWMMLNYTKPDNYVLATSETHSVREFVELAFEEIGIKVKWVGKGEEEYGINEKTGEKVVEVNPKYYRPIDIEALIGDYTKAKEVLGWAPKTSFRELVKLMVADSKKRANGN
jgi:GDPmannose 4,6-dehydratase